MQLGTFDTSKEAFDAIAVGKLQFAIGQQQALQGALSVMLASTFATTGKTVAPSSEVTNGVYLSGPNIVNLGNLPSDTLQSCQNEGFPVCQSGSESDVNLDYGTCPCIDRSKIRIGGVLHGGKSVRSIPQPEMRQIASSNTSFLISLNQKSDDGFVLGYYLRAGCPGCR